MPEELTDDEILLHDSLETDDEGFVTGSAYTRQRDGYDVQAAVFSYEYERNGETRMNHVPNVVLTDEDGKIVAEPHARDWENPSKAMDAARSTAVYTFRHLGEYVD